MAGFSRRAKDVGFSVPASGARFAGTLSDDGTRLKGIWTLPGQPDVEVAFLRTRASAEREPRLRPQTPKPPFPYRAEEVTFKNPVAAGVTLAGTLTLPKGTGPFPVAVLITGSGPQDRDQTLLGHKPFAVLADHLTRNGWPFCAMTIGGWGDPRESLRPRPRPTSQPMRSPTGRRIGW